MKLLFLDFDGLLHSTNATPGQWLSRADNLAEALAGRECAIVISSRWRHHNYERELVAMLPTRMHARVVGTTGDAYVGRHARYTEILVYLQPVAGPASPWRALDDSRFVFPADFPELIACEPNIGFSGEQAAALRKWLTDGQ
jgi:hypothetical protein